MKRIHRIFIISTVLGSLPLVAGCSKSSSPPKPQGGPSATTPESTPAEQGTSTAAPAANESAAISSNSKDNEEPVSDKPFKLGDLLGPFTPPSLEELDKTAGWSDRLVASGMDLLRKKQEASGPPPTTAAEAIKLRNDFPKVPNDNDKILNTLSRLAPADNVGVDLNGSIVRHVAGDLKSSNPLLQSSTTEGEFYNLTGIGLLAFDENFKHFAPQEVVVSWQTSKDHLMDKMVIRDDLTWSDGKPVTAQDVMFTFQVIMTESVPILALRTTVEQLKWAQAYDDHTIVFFHKEALATNDANMNFPIIPKHIYEKTLPDDPRMARSDAHTQLEDHPVVGGAYELVRRERNQEFVVRRRESYYMHDGKQVRPKPYFSEVRVKVIEDLNTALLAMKAGQIEQMELRAEQWKNQTNDDAYYEKNTKVTALEWTEFHFNWNNKSQYFTDKRVRQAMSWAFDYDEFLNKIAFGLYQPCQGTYHPKSWCFPKNGPQPYHQDLDKAEDLLDAAGWKDTDGDGVRDKEINGQRVPFEFTLLTAQTETALQVATLMKECLGKIGITCNVKPTEFTVLVDSQQKRKFDGAFGGWGTGTDPDESANLFVTGEMRNYCQYSNPRVDELFKQGRREFDPEKRAAIYGEIHNLMWEDQPCTWLFYRNAFYGFSKKLRGYNFSPKGPFDFSPGFDGIYQAAAP